MAKDQKEQGSFTALWMVLALIVAIGTWMFITPEHLLKSLAGERAFVTELSGQQADQWIFSKTISVSASQIQGMSDAIKDAKDTPGALKEWIHACFMPPGFDRSDPVRLLFIPPRLARGVRRLRSAMR